MPSNVQIYSPQSSAALNYVLEFVFNEFYGCGFSLVSEVNAVWDNKISINYSSEKIENALQILPSEYIFEKDLSRFPKVEISRWGEIPVIFQSSGDLPFDLFGAIFFLLSRAEEYANLKRDLHGRFRAEYSVFDDEIIARPLVDEWLILFKKLYLKNSDLRFSERNFQWINTYDIDVAYAFKYRSLSRKIGATLKNLLSGDFHSIKKRFSVLLNGEADPFDTYDFQEEVSRDYPNRTIYFFLLGDKTRYDRNLSASSKGMRTLIQKVSIYADVGIHPTYASVDTPELVSKEINRLSSNLQKSVIKSRQHFLRFKLPETYSNLIKNGILEEYSMGYADRPGFRAGTCTPYYFFDLNKNQATRLKIFPLIVMDATLRDYQFLDSKIAAETLKDMVLKVKTVGGVFVSLWHNDTLQDTPENFWRKLYLEMATYTRDS